MFKISISISIIFKVGVCVGGVSTVWGRGGD